MRSTSAAGMVGVVAIYPYGITYNRTVKRTILMIVTHRTGGTPSRLAAPFGPASPRKPRRADPTTNDGYIGPRAKYHTKSAATAYISG
jgi:hypothetical protein